MRADSCRIATVLALSVAVDVFVVNRLAKVNDNLCCTSLVQLPYCLRPGFHLAQLENVEEMAQGLANHPEAHSIVTS